MSTGSTRAASLEEGYARAAIVLRSGERVGAVHRTLCNEAAAVERGRSVHQALSASADWLVGGPAEEADRLTDELWDGLWDGPLELDRSVAEEGTSGEFRALGTLKLSPESTWTVLLDCLGDTYIVALEEHADRAAAEARFDVWSSEIANA